MCHYITAVAPSTIHIGEHEALINRFGRSFHPIENRSVMAQAPRGSSYYATTRGHCDCGTSLGASRYKAQPPRTWEREAKRLRREGWSEAKIRRWLAGKVGGQHEVERRATERAAACEKDAGNWLQFIQEFLRESEAAFLGLLLHWYDGPMTGRIEIVGTESVRADHLTSAFLMKMDEDVLYLFTNRLSVRMP